MSANIGCYSEKREQPRIEKIKSVINDVKTSIGFETSTLAGLAEAQLSQLASSQGSSQAASEAKGHEQEQGQALAASQAASLGTSSNDSSSPSTSTKQASSGKREKSPYVLTVREISYQLYYGENYIGRDQSNQIVIENSHISRLHALVVVHSNRVAIFDLGSLNRTFVNDRMITCAAVEVGDNIKLGSCCQLTLKLSAQLEQLTDGHLLTDNDHSNSSLIN
ncbi:MAG: FHA domain-containing protein [Blastocatellia bacterium]